LVICGVVAAVAAGERAIAREVRTAADATADPKRLRDGILRLSLCVIEEAGGDVPVSRRPRNVIGSNPAILFTPGRRRRQETVIDRKHQVRSVWSAKFVPRFPLL
jgi:hypothetical protein